MARHWTCKKCKARWPRTKQNCATLECKGRRPAPRQAKHKAVLDRPYDEWVAVYGEQCGICGRKPTSRKLDRDHSHKTGRARGLLCHLCNRALPEHATVEWLVAAQAYLERAEVSEALSS